MNIIMILLTGAMKWKIKNKKMSDNCKTCDKFIKIVNAILNM